MGSRTMQTQSPQPLLTRGNDGGPHGSMPLPPVDRAGAVMLYEDSNEPNRWLPLPTRDDIQLGDLGPVSFANGSHLEVHGKLYGDYGRDINYYDDIGLPSMPIEVRFDGDIVPMHNVTGNSTSLIAPFWEFGNGTFQFRLWIDKPAGEYELVMEFDGLHWLIGVRYVTMINVNHPTTIEMELSSSRVLPGMEVEVRGNLTDDTGVRIADALVGVWWEDRLLGPSAQGVYIDDVEVDGANWSDDFEGKNGSWSTFSASSVPNQWERGFPKVLPGPIPRSWVNAWVTKLNRYYERGAWSYLVSPVIDMSEDREYTLSFWAWWKLPWSDDKAYVVVSTDYGETWDEGHAITFTEETLTRIEWQYVEMDLSRYSGSDHVRFAFVFHSPAKTMDAGEDGSFSFSHRASSDVGRYDVRVAFPGDLHFQPSEDTVRITVVRNTRIELDEDPSGRTGHRNGPTVIRGRLLDDQGRPLRAEVDGDQYIYYVMAQWPWKGWSIDDDIGYPPFPSYPRVNPETGEFEIEYVVGADHELGPVNISVRFYGTDFYNGVQVVEVVHVKANLHVTVPPRENRSFHRGQFIDLGADLRIVPTESLEDQVLGDLVDVAFVKVYWNGQLISGRRTDFGNIDHGEFLVPSTHYLGAVNVTFEYEGNATLEPFTQTFKYYVVSDTFIVVDGKVVSKGEWVMITGRITDDKGEPVPSVPVYIVWRRAPEIGRVHSDVDGRFSLQYYIEYEDKVGNVTVIARFKGDGFHSEGEGRANYTITGDTVLERRDKTLSVFQGSSVRISARLYQGWEGYWGNPIAQATVTLSMDGVVMASKRTSFDGTVTFTVPIDPDVFKGGHVEVVLRFNGTDEHPPAINRTTLFVQVMMLMSVELELNGLPLDEWNDLARRGDTIRVVVSVMTPDHVPWPGREVSIFHMMNRRGTTERLLLEAETDEMGQLELVHILTEDTPGTVSLYITSPGLTAGDWVDLRYIVPPSDTVDDIIDMLGEAEVRVGADMDLHARVRERSEWNMDQLMYALVSAPEDMEISGDGTFRWKPTKDHVGDHSVVVWLYDGERNEAQVVNITVVEPPGAMDVALPVLAFASLAVLVLMAIRRQAARRDD